MKNFNLRCFFFTLSILLSASVMAEGNCSFRAYSKCYADNPMGNPPQAMIRALCLMHSEIKEGMFTTESLKSCKAEARQFGQYVKIQFHDFETNSETSARVYQ